MYFFRHISKAHGVPEQKLPKMRRDFDHPSKTEAASQILKTF